MRRFSFDFDEEGFAVQWLPYELRSASEPLPQPGGGYSGDHWRAGVRELAQAYGTEVLRGLAEFGVVDPPPGNIIHLSAC